MPQGIWYKMGTWHPYPPPPLTIRQTAVDDKPDIAKLRLQRLEMGAGHMKRIRTPRLAAWYRAGGAGLEHGTRSPTSKRIKCNDAVPTALPIKAFMWTVQHQSPCTVICITWRRIINIPLGKTRLFIYLFICGLFSDVHSNSVMVASHGRTICWWIINWLGSGRGRS